MSFNRVLVRFVTWGLFVLLVPVVCLWLLADAGDDDRRVEKFYEVASDLNALSIGSSHSRGLHFPTLGIDGYSFVDDRADIETAELKARLAAPYIPDLRYVILTVSPGYLSYDWDLLFYDEWDHKAAILRNTPAPRDKSDFTLGELFDLARARILTFETARQANDIARAGIGNAVRTALGASASGFRTRCAEPRNPASTPDEHGIRHGLVRTALPADCLPDRIAYELWSRYNKIKQSLASDPDIRQTNYLRLLRLADFAEDSGAELVVVVPPLTKEYFEDEHMQEFWVAETEYLEKLREHPAVTLLDCHDLYYDTDYMFENEVFVDGNHLTLKGAVGFSEVIRDQLRAIRLAGESG